MWLGLLLVCSPARLSAWTPGTANPTAVQGFIVDPANRTDVLSFYHCIYSASVGYAADMNWTGTVDAGVAGTTSAAFKEHVRRRINFYRALTALPADIVFDATKNSQCQQAALMMSHNNALDHDPPMDWLSYTAEGAEAANQSNLALGAYGPGAIDFLVRDLGGGVEVGHRRWFLYSRVQSMGTGDIPPASPYASAHATWVIGDEKPVPAPQFVAWPNRGYSPFPLRPERWSLSYPGANFSGAAVTMTQGGNNVPATIISNSTGGFGDNTIVWVPAGLPASIAADTSYQVMVTGIGGAGVPASYSYTVTVFDPNVLGAFITVNGSATPPTTGANYTFNSITQADSYEVQVSTGSNAGWSEGAETASPLVIDGTAVSYELVQATVKRSGSNAFHLTLPNFEAGAQSFEIARDLVPAAGSLLTFHDLFRFVTTASRLSAEVSSDHGSTWTEVFGRNGNGSTSSSGWDTAFQPRSVSLSAWAGTPVRLRFIFRDNNSAFLGTSTNLGVFLDDISVSNATQLLSPTVTAVPGNVTAFTLNAAAAGAPLVAGVTYYLRLRPNVGCRWFGYGTLKAVTAQPSAGYAGWVATQFPAVIEGPLGNHESDSYLNGIEYAFGLNPLLSDPAGSVPQPVRTGSIFGVTFAQPTGIAGVTYAAEWSPNMKDWIPITDTGMGATHTFDVDTTGEPNVFFRHRITIVP